MPRSGWRAASTAALLKRVLTSPSYRGKHVILLRGRVYTAASGRELTRLFDRLVKEHPGATPTLAYVPTAQTLVLILLRAESGRSAASAAGVPAST